METYGLQALSMIKCGTDVKKSLVVKMGYNRGKANEELFTVTLLIHAGGRTIQELLVGWAEDSKTDWANQHRPLAKDDDATIEKKLAYLRANNNKTVSVIPGTKQTLMIVADTASIIAEAQKTGDWSKATESLAALQLAIEASKNAPVVETEPEE